MYQRSDYCLCCCSHCMRARSMTDTLSPFNRFWLKKRTTFLIVFWTAGCISGILFALCADFEGSVLFSDAVRQSVTLRRILLVEMLPFIVCALAISSSEHWIIPFLGGMKGFAFCFNACAISTVFGESGWLIRSLLLFSDMLTVPLFYWFCLRYYVGDGSSLRREWPFWLIILIAIGCMDFLFVAPFLSGLFQ